MENNKMNAIKDFIVGIYYSKGHKIGLHLLSNIGIAAICVILMNVMTGTKITFSGALSWIISLPIFAVIIMVVRLIHKMIPMPFGIAKIIVDLIIVAVVVTGAGFLINKIPFPESDVLQIIIAVVFDVIYIGIMVFFLLAGKNEYDYD